MGEGHAKELNKEQRKSPRAAVNMRCVYSIDNGPDCKGTATDLSVGGCAISGIMSVKKGDYLRLLIFPSKDPVPIGIQLAPVRWTCNERFGVEFMTLKRGDAERLQTYLKLSKSDWPSLV